MVLSGTSIVLCSGVYCICSSTWSTSPDVIGSPSLHAKSLDVNSCMSSSSFENFVCHDSKALSQCSYFGFNRVRVEARLGMLSLYLYFYSQSSLACGEARGRVSAKIAKALLIPSVYGENVRRSTSLAIVSIESCDVVVTYLDVLFFLGMKHLC
jgi:hypothetical protein